jgi:hypothetical protein
MPYLRVHINDGGYIYPATSRSMVHKETRSLHVTHVCHETLDDAKPMLLSGHAVLELTDEGGGKALWVRPRDRERWESLLKIWNGCYGAWPLREMKEAA